MESLFLAAKFIFTGMLIYRATLNLGRLEDMTKRASSKGIPVPWTAGGLPNKCRDFMLIE